jgi:uncharacterized membrane-anchored protein YhcB (DUF1043 family)
MNTDSHALLAIISTLSALLLLAVGWFINYITSKIKKLTLSSERIRQQIEVQKREFEVYKEHVNGEFKIIEINRTRLEKKVYNEADILTTLIAKINELQKK